VRVTFAQAEPNGLADLVGRLIQANLARHPERRRLVRSAAVVELTAWDADTSATIRLGANGIDVSNGTAGPTAHLRVLARANDLLELAAAPLRFGLPDAFDPRGRAVLRSLAMRDVRVSGMVRHPVRLSRFTRLLSVAP
jgi:hypothetical protein